MFIDTHCHLNIMVGKKPQEPLTAEHLKLIEQIVINAQSAGVEKIINVGTCYAESQNSIAIAKLHPNVFATAGIHPCDLGSDWRVEFEGIKKLVREREKNKIIAIGETGLDFYHEPFDKARQIDAFRAHIELALAHDLPLIVHVRNAPYETLKVLDEYKKEARGVNHCFVHGLDYARELISWGFYLGINGPLNYPKNEEMRAVVAQLPLEHLILETDAPFLPPQEYRGKQNSPVYIPLIAKALALTQGKTLAEVERVTTQNVEKLFRLS